jgi:hypothetical protein
MTLTLPNSELVACAWIATVPGFTSAMVGTTLPSIQKTLPAWVSTGFITVMVVGGTPGAYMPQAAPVVQVDCWAVNATQVGVGGPINVATKPPWGTANGLAEQIRAASYGLNKSAGGRRLAMPVAGYAHAAVQSAQLMSEPRRLPADPASYARYQFDLQLFWVAEAT